MIAGQSFSTNGTLPGSGVVNLDVAPEDFIYGVHYSTHIFYRINPSTGAAQTVGVYDSELWGATSRPGFGQPLLILTAGSSFGFTNGHLGFKITGSSGQTAVIEVSTNLQRWLPFQTNVLGEDRSTSAIRNPATLAAVSIAGECSD